MQLNVIRADDTITHIAILGRLDVQGVHAIHDRFLITMTARKKSAIVDISEVSFIASLGMGMLISAAKALQRQGVKMVIVAPTEMVQQALDAAGISHVIPIARAEADALQLLR